MSFEVYVYNALALGRFDEMICNCHFSDHDFDSNLYVEHLFIIDHQNSFTQHNVCWTIFNIL